MSNDLTDNDLVNMEWMQRVGSIWAPTVRRQGPVEAGEKLIRLGFAERADDGGYQISQAGQFELDRRKLER